MDNEEYIIVPSCFSSGKIFFANRIEFLKVSWFQNVLLAKEAHAFGANVFDQNTNDFLKEILPKPLKRDQIKKSP